MISDVCHLSSRLYVIDRHHVCEFALVNLDVDIECSTESSDLHVVTIGTSLSHLSQMTLEDPGDLLRSWAAGIEGGGKSTSILSLRVSPYTTPWIDIYELLVEIGMLTHVVDRGRAYFAMP